MGISIRNTIKFKKRKDHTNTFELNIIIIKNIKGREDDNFNNSNNKNHKKIKISKFDKYYGE